jgi:hypothetical protein
MGTTFFGVRFALREQFHAHCARCGFDCSEKVGETKIPRGQAGV